MKSITSHSLGLRCYSRQQAKGPEANQLVQGSIYERDKSRGHSVGVRIEIHTDGGNTVTVHVPYISMLELLVKAVEADKDQIAIIQAKLDEAVETHSKKGAE